MRVDGRENKQLRPVHMEKHFIKHAEGSVFITVGDTKVICTASIDDKVPPFMRGGGKGWITAEYAMLPRATERKNVCIIANRRRKSNGSILRTRWKRSGITCENIHPMSESFLALFYLDFVEKLLYNIDCL